MDLLDQHYQALTVPTEFIKNFKTRADFKKWAHGGAINDLKEAIVSFEHYELYEHCAVMQEVIDEKVDKMLEGFGFE